MPVRIAILGGPRCGKTTLIQQLYVDMKIKGLSVGAATEYSTDYLKDKGMIEHISEQYGIYLGQLQVENNLNVFDYAITDYATFVPYIYGRFMLGSKKRSNKEIEILKDLYFLALKDLPKYDYIFKDVYGELIFQEGFLQLSMDMCGFTEIEADKLRKAVGDIWLPVSTNIGEGWDANTEISFNFKRLIPS